MQRPGALSRRYWYKPGAEPKSTGLGSEGKVPHERATPMSVCSCADRCAVERDRASPVFQMEVNRLRGEVAQLKKLLLAHKDCPVFIQQRDAGQISLEGAVLGTWVCVRVCVRACVWCACAAPSSSSSRTQARSASRALCWVCVCVCVCVCVRTCVYVCVCVCVWCTTVCVCERERERERERESCL